MRSVSNAGWYYGVMTPPQHRTRSSSHPSSGTGQGIKYTNLGWAQHWKLNKMDVWLERGASGRVMKTSPRWTRHQTIHPVIIHHIDSKLKTAQHEMSLGVGPRAEPSAGSVPGGAVAGRLRSNIIIISSTMQSRARPPADLSMGLTRLRLFIFTLGSCHYSFILILKTR